MCFTSSTVLAISGGLSERTRACKGPFYGGQDCHGDVREAKDCNQTPCPINGVFSTESPVEATRSVIANGSTIHFVEADAGADGVWDHLDSVVIGQQVRIRFFLRKI